MGVVERAEIPLRATSTRGARREILGTYRKGAIYYGYDALGECVLASQVLPKDEVAFVWTSRRTVGKAVRFTCIPLPL